jgi:hypothetical protein
VNKKSFSRTSPLVTNILEKPMTQWASGKIKRIYDGYESFCQEVGKLLGEPLSKPHVSHSLSPQMIDEFDLLWEDLPTFEQNTQQLLTLLSSFYKAGFVVKSHTDGCRVKSYFIEKESQLLGPILNQTFTRFTPPLASNEEDLHPKKIQAHPILKTLGLQKLSWQENSVAIHFWLYPHDATSLVLLSDAPEPQRHQIVIKTQALIQRRFY